jgi:hypothetical protein
MGHDLDRRTFLKGGLFATMALAATPLRASSGSPAAAYELTQAGHEVTVLEARSRAGARGVGRSLKRFRRGAARCRASSSSRR